MRRRNTALYVLLLICTVLNGCGTAGRLPEVSVDAAAEIPEEVWEGLDPQTREAIAEGTKYIALTFDDGPRYETTKRLLDGLLERDAKATFFVIGTQVMCHGNEELVQRMEREGHQVGNHTFSHVRLNDEREDTVLEEIRKNRVILENILGEGEYWLRPPYGLIDSSRAALVETPMIYWTLDPEDWKSPDGKRVADYVVDNVEDGDIVLLHDFYPGSVDAALEIIDRLQPEGYVFVTVEELFRIYGITPREGILYASPTAVRPI